jgi:DeoR family fructose operon transcriptional repressor
MRRNERRMAILQHLHGERTASVAVLSRQFNVSEMTIRRDLDWLEDRGHVRRIFGGAMATELASFVLAFQGRAQRFAEEKERIGQAAAELVEDGESVILGAGTTVLQVAKHLREKRVTVVTDSLQVILELSSVVSVELILIGGVFSRSALATVGPHVGEFLKGICADKLFLAGEGVHASHGLTVPDVIEAQAKKSLIESASEVYVLADHSKLGRSALHTVTPLGNVDAIITDDGAPGEIVAQLKEHCRVIVA